MQHRKHVLMNTKRINHSKQMEAGNFELELKLEKAFRKLPWLIPTISICTGILLVGGIVVCMHYFSQNNYWTIIPAGFLVHAFFIVIIHDGAHKAITKTRFDRVLMNLGSALMLLPFYGEYFRKYHLMHHANTNSDVDPLWPSSKKTLFEDKRWLYILCECIPLLFTIYLVFTFNREKKDSKSRQTIKSPKVNIGYLIFSTGSTLLIIIYVLPPVWFCLGTLFVLNLISAWRHWCEHLGTDVNRTSNTFWFPLGMGIGNHDMHHHFPHVSWVVLLIGLFYRKKTTNPFKTVFSVLFNRSFVHYKGK
jgi:fatty acid desaturase